VKILSTLLNDYGGGECSYESYQTKTLSTPGGKQNRLLKITK